MTTPIGAAGSTTPTTQNRMTGTGTTGAAATGTTGTSTTGTSTTGTGTTGTGGASGIWTGATPAASTKSKTEMDKDLFLKLLVSQLKYQDPSKPTDTAAFLSQTAQFTQVERMDQIAEAQTGLLSAQLRQTAAQMVGRTVTYTDSDGTEATGKVTSATLTGTNPTLHIGNTDVPLNSIKQITGDTAQSTAPAGGENKQATGQTG